jgi:hypothetical protein
MTHAEWLLFRRRRRNSTPGASEFSNHRQRGVNGYGLMQPASDIFLGWVQGVRDLRHCFIRQLRDIKISIRVETFGAPEMQIYATWCGRALALPIHGRDLPPCSAAICGRAATSTRRSAPFRLPTRTGTKRTTQR